MNGHCSSVSWIRLNSGQMLPLELTFKFFTSTESSTINSQLRPGWGSVKHEWRFSYVNKVAVNSFNKPSIVIQNWLVHTASFPLSCPWLKWHELSLIPSLFHQVLTCLASFETWQLFLMDASVKLIACFIQVLTGDNYYFWVLYLH